MAHISPSPVTSTFGSVVQPYLLFPTHPTYCLSSTTLPVRMLLASQLPVSSTGCGLRPQKLLNKWSYSSVAMVREETLCHNYAHLTWDQTHEWLEHLSKSLSLWYGSFYLSSFFIEHLNFQPLFCFPLLPLLLLLPLLYYPPNIFIAPHWTWNRVRSWGHKNE